MPRHAVSSVIERLPSSEVEADLHKAVGLFPVMTLGSLRASQRPLSCWNASSSQTTCRTRFWWDLVAWIPWDYIVLLVLGDFHAGDSIVARVPILRLFRLVRILNLYNSLLAPHGAPSLVLGPQLYITRPGLCTSEALLPSCEGPAAGRMVARIVGLNMPRCPC